MPPPPPPPQPHAKSSEWDPSSFPYPVDYNDHFETPLQAYQDIQPMIDWLFEPKKETNGRPTLVPVLYDPYYCNGTSKVLLESLGYRNVVHERRDFYDDVRTNRVPNHDVLVTNPPYSDDHKIRCLEYCCSRLARTTKTTTNDSTISSASSRKAKGSATSTTKPVPFFVLVPSYVASKAYYRSCLERHGLRDTSSGGGGHSHGGDESRTDGVVYLVPNRSPNSSVGYRYEHPEGTGHDVAPFESLWMCGIGHDRARCVREWWRSERMRAKEENSAGAVASGSGVTLYCSLDELERAGVISTERRPNPRQRRKRKTKQQFANPTSHGATAVDAAVERHSPEAMAAQGGTKRSKYRDESGTRSKRRF